MSTAGTSLIKHLPWLEQNDERPAPGHRSIVGAVVVVIGATVVVVVVLVVIAGVAPDPNWQENPENPGWHTQTARLVPTGTHCPPKKF